MSIPKTKLRPPILRHPIVLRPRLTNTFTDRRPLTIVSAPAGSGKTTLALEWLKTSNSKVAWLSLDEDDNDPIRFMNGLIAALQTIKLKIHIPTGQRDIQSIITEIINQFNNTKPITLALDDYHLITEPRIHSAFTYLLDHIPAALQLVLITREEPPLPLARLRARGQLREFHIDELRFTPEEAKQFLNQVMGLDLTVDQIQVLEQHTQGWIAGLQLAALSLQSNRAQNFPNASERQFITEYLLTEVFNRQSQEVQTFLLNTSIPDKFSIALCKALDFTHAQDTISTIEKSNLFVTALDAAWYQYHPLFREFLQIQLQNKFPQRAHELHTSAGKWLEENGFTAEAIPHAIANADYETVARLIATLAPDYFQRGELITLRRWLDLLPDSVKWTQPRLCLTQIWLLLDSDLRIEAEVHLERLNDFLKNNLGGEFLAVRALHAAMTHQPALALEYAQQAQESPEAKDPFIQTYVAFGLGAAQKMGLNLFQAEQSFRSALALADAAGNTYIAISALANLADTQYMRAQLTDSQNTCKEALKRYADDTPDANDWYWNQARIAYQRNSLKEALSLINRAIDFCAKWQNSATQHARALLQQAMINYALGNKSAAYENLDSADGMSRGLQEKLVLRSIIRQRVLFATNNGRLEDAQQWLSTLLEYGKQPYPFYYTFAQGRVLLAEGKLKAARSAFNSTLDYLSGLDCRLVQIETLIWQAITLHKLGGTSQAALVLNQAIKLAKPGGVIHPFVEARQGLLPLLKAAGTSLKDGGIAKALEQDREKSRQVEGPVLTRREKEILQLLTIGLSNQEMAEKLFIAEGTLKRHVANLYQKLGVHNRAQAIRQFNQQS